MLRRLISPGWLQSVPGLSIIVCIELHVLVLHGPSTLRASNLVPEPVVKIRSNGCAYADQACRRRVCAVLGHREGREPSHGFSFGADDALSFAAENVDGDALVANLGRIP